MLLPQHFPLTRVDLKGDFEKTSKAELEAALPRISGNFFAADLAEVRAGVERLPWVRHVAVRRVWPGRLEISIEEHVALARWGDDALVNTYGETFRGKTDEVLPVVHRRPRGTAGRGRAALRGASRRSWRRSAPRSSAWC